MSEIVGTMVNCFICPKKKKKKAQTLESSSLCFPIYSVFIMGLWDMGNVQTIRDLQVAKILLKDSNEIHNKRNLKLEIQR